VIFGAVLAAVGSARHLPNVPAVVHPPVPQDGEYEDDSTATRRNIPEDAIS
jgi:hypothetical protein